MDDWYLIVVRGHLDDHWSAWFGGLTIAHNDRGETLLSGRIVDQAALHGVLTQVRDMGLALISVNRIESDSQGRGSMNK
jgi:hypothetical protein